LTNVQYQQTAEHGILHRPVSQFLDVEHHIHSSFEKSIIIERTIQYIKDRTEGFDVVIVGPAGMNCGLNAIDLILKGN